MLQAAGYLPDLPDHKEGDSIVAGELGLHGEVRRVPGVLSLAYMAKAGQRIVFESVVERAVDFGKIRGQEAAKEAALLAAAGGHNLLLIGPPGEGKSPLASAMPGILPRPGEITMGRAKVTQLFSMTLMAIAGA